MVEPVDRLMALFEADEAPAFDPIFALAVVAEVERRQAMRQLAWNAAYVALALVLLVAGWPAIQALSGGIVQAFGSAAPFIAAAAIGGAVLFWAGRIRLPDLSFG